MKTRFSKIGVVALSAISMCVAAGGLWRTAQAQADRWTQPQLIFEGRGTINAPTLVADAFGQMHAFWLFQADQQGDLPQQQVYYTRLDRPTWPVNDIFVGAASTASLKAVMTRDGLALLWGGNNFAWSGVSPHATAQDWSGPLSTDGAFPESGLSLGPDGSLWLIYGATGSNELFVQHLNPDTRQWDAPLLVGDPVSPSAAPDGTRLAISADGAMHAVWAEYQLPNGWPPVGLYYAQSKDGGHTWSGRHKIADTNFNQPNVVAGPNRQVYITWTGTAGTGQKYFLESLDEGQTWENSVIVMSQAGGGSEGPPSLAVDSGGDIHMVFSHNGCVWHVSRDNNLWSQPECISVGAPSSSLIESPAMALSMGNRLYVLFWTDRRQLWFTTRELPLAAQTPAPTPTSAVPTVAPTTPAPTVAPSQTPLPDYGPPVKPEQAVNPGIWALAAGVAPVVSLFFVAALFRRSRRR